MHPDAATRTSVLLRPASSGGVTSTYSGRATPSRTRVRPGETVFVLYEYDGRFRNVRRPLLSRALYSVTPNAHYRLDHKRIERRRDGTLAAKAVRRARDGGVGSQPGP
jgi:hypothetical protein